MRHGNAGTFRPVLDEIDHGIADIMGDPRRF
jgi:hypothetical protein